MPQQDNLTNLSLSMALIGIPKSLQVAEQIRHRGNTP